MSAWDAYIQSMKSSGLQVCGIYGLDGGVWAQSPEMKATQQEVAAIVSGIKSQTFSQGLTIGGVRYTVIRVFPETVTAKCRGAAREDENYLLHAALAKTCVIIGGICGPSERDATKLVEDIRDYLEKSNYWCVCESLRNKGGKDIDTIRTIVVLCFVITYRLFCEMSV